MTSTLRISIAVLAALLAACSPDDTSDGVVQSNAAATDNLRHAALDMMEAALDAAINADDVQGERIVLRSDVPASAALSAKGLSLGVLVQELAERRGLQTAVRDLVMVCEGEIGPGNMHPCKVNLDGQYYQLDVLSFAPGQGKVAVHTGEGGTMVVELARDRSGWTVTGYDMIAS